MNQAGDVSNLVELLERRSASIRGYRYLVDGEVAGARIEWTYAELDRRSRAVAARLERLGLRGQRALLLFPPGLDFAAAFFGAIYAGVVPVPVAPPDPTRLELTLPRLQAIARDARPAAILTVSAVRDLMEQLVTLAPELCVLETIATDACSMRCEAANAGRPPDVSPHALAFLQYTSGSTGAPKGVMVSHANLLENARIIAHVVQHVPGERESVSWLPLFHDLGLIGMLLLHLYMDRSITFMSPLDFLKRPMRWLEAISHFKAGLSGGPNFAYALVARKARPEEIAALDLSSWQLAFSGAETVRADALTAFARTFAAAHFDPRAFLPTYGLAEATLAVAGGHILRGLTMKRVSSSALGSGRIAEGDDATLVSVGPPSLDTEIAILRSDGSHAAANEVAEICVQSPSVALGFWERPRETAEVFGFRSADGRAWLRTGDLGALIDGELYVIGRTKDLIILRGQNHYPEDIERTVEAAHTAIRAGCVAAFSVPAQGEEGLALVAECRPGADPIEIEQAVRAALSERHSLALTGLSLVPPGALLKTSSGKVRRQDCRKAWLEHRLRPIHAVGASQRTNGWLGWIGEWLIENAKVPAHSIARELRLTDLGLDSLTIVALAGAMEERISLEVPVELVFDRSLGELEEWLETTRLPLTSIERPDLEVAASLAEEIRITTQPQQAGAILLTGATGFLGAFLLTELLTRQTGRVSCLVRGADESRNRARLHATARRLGLVLDDDRIDIVTGDLSNEALGLTTDELQRLARRCRLIVHAAGVVDWSARFETLAQVNVGGTREIVRLSALGGGVPIHHVSSLGVFPFGLSRRERFGESEQLAEGDLLRVPYFQSKWAAERLLEHARLRKIPVSIYRPGFIGGHSRTGKELSPASQLFCAFVAGASRMGAVPALEKMLDVVPVDYVASAVVALALQEQGASRSRNLVNPSPLPQNELYAILRREGLTLAPVPFGRWRERVLRLPREDADNPLARFALYYRSLTPQLMLRIERLFAQRMPVDDEATRAELAALEIRCPAFDGALIQTYIRAWEEAGVLRRDAERVPGPHHVARS